MLLAGPLGSRFYHTHLRAGSDLSRGHYNGLVCPVDISSLFYCHLQLHRDCGFMTLFDCA